jgi:putative acetyltransferase
MPTTTSSGRSRAVIPVTVRVEESKDRAAVDELVEEAFGEPSVKRLVQLIRASEHWVPELSLVADRDGELVGHILLSTTDLVSDGATEQILLLSPLAVRPGAQGSGIARRLVEEGIAAADGAGYSVIVLEGDPGLYRRLGFQPATALGIERPSDLIPEPAWQAHPLAAYHDGIRGRVTYQSAFWETGSVGP